MLCCAVLRCAALCCVLLCCSVLCCAVPVPVPVPVTGILKSAVFFSRDVVVKLYEIDNMLACVCVCVYVCVSAFARAVFLLVQNHQQLRFMYGVACHNSDLPLLLLTINYRISTDLNFHQVYTNMT